MSETTAEQGAPLMIEDFGGLQVSMEGAIDLHCHPYPDLFPRLTDDMGVAAAASDAKMRAIVLKCHHESTASRAYHVQKQFPDLKVYGGIVLNSYVGYINPNAVEATLRMGGRFVWMPTVDAGYHAQIHGATGSYGVQEGGLEADPVWILDEDGEITDETRTVLELVAEHDAVLGTCHLSPREIVKLVREARALGVERILVTHPFFKVPNLDLGTLQELVRLGARPEFGYCTVSAAWQYATLDKVAHAIATVGSQNCVLVSDTGQRHNPIPAEALRVFAQGLFERGVTEEAIQNLVRNNPADILDLPTGRLT